VRKEILKNMINEKKRTNEVPMMYKWIADETWGKYGDKLKNITKKYKDDFAIIDYLTNTYLKEKNVKKDEWGRVTKSSAVGSRTIEYPIKEWDDVPIYLKRFPDSKNPDRFKNFFTYWAHAQVFEEHPFKKVETEKVLREHEGEYIIGLVFPAINERLMGIIPADIYFSGFYTNQREIINLSDKLVEFDKGIIDGYSNLSVDGIWFSDDWGTQNNLMISPELWRHFFRPRYESLCEYTHNKGMQVWFHSCGNITKIIPDFINIGVDVLHLGQPYVMDIDNIVKEYKDKICFFGGIDVQNKLLNSSPLGVQKHVEEILMTFKDSCFILSPTNSITPDVPLENIASLFEVMKDRSGN
jgi:uroporphyrinogen decarboxylase